MIISSKKNKKATQIQYLKQWFQITSLSNQTALLVVLGHMSAHRLLFRQVPIFQLQSLNNCL